MKQIKRLTIAKGLDSTWSTCWQLLKITRLMITRYQNADMKSFDWKGKTESVCQVFRYNQHVSKKLKYLNCIAKQTKNLLFLKRLGFHLKYLLVAVIAVFAADAVQFDCNFQFFPMAVVGRVYSCQASVVLSGSSNLENVTGVHQSEYTNDDVEFLFPFQQNMTFIPQRIVNFFKNLKALDWSTGLLSISAEDLRPFPQLEYLALDWNGFTTLDGDLFSFTPLLKLLDLDWNRIQHIGHDLLTNLENLQQLYLRENYCIDSQATNRAAVVSLIAWMSTRCPPLITTTDATTSASKTTVTGHKSFTTTKQTTGWKKIVKHSVTSSKLLWKYG